MKTVYGFGKQNSQHDIYSYPCGSFTVFPCKKTNNVTDWIVGSKKCCWGWCSDQLICSKPDKENCFIGTDVSGHDPVVSIEWDSKAPNFKCTFDLNKINTESQIQNFVNKFGQNQDFGKLVNSFCVIPSQHCPIDPSTNNPMFECSRLKSLDSEGTNCRNWVENNENVQDEIINEYCLHNPQNKDCSCVNRANNDFFKNAKLRNPIKDGCWYVPCSDSSNLIPSSVKIRPNDCPQNMCETIYDLHQNNNVVVSNNENNIKCNFSNFTPTNSTGSNGIDAIVFFLIIMGALFLLMALFR